MRKGSPLSEGFRDNLSTWFDMAARHDGDMRISTWVAVRPDLCDADGAMRLAALAFAVDSAVGMSAGFSVLPKWVVTSDMDLRVFADARVGPLRTEARPLRVGRSQALAEAWLYDEGQGDLLIGHATANHGVLVPENGPPLAVSPVGVIQRQVDDWDTTVARPPMAVWFGARLVGPGVCEIDLAANVRNPWGILHGALHVLLVEEAARSLVDGRVTHMSERFMAPARVGPVRASATVLGGVGSLVTVRVEVRDADAENRLCSLGLVTIEAQ